MKLVKNLPRRRSKNGRYWYQYGLFCCPTCGRHVEMTRYYGHRSEGCSRCLRGWHGLWAANKRLYIVWTSMRRRCRSPRAQSWSRYGGRGITICGEWETFAAFHAWATSHGYKPGLSIDRIDPDGNYEPRNCRWLTVGDNTSRATRKLTDAQAAEIRCLHSLAGWGYKRIARCMGVPRITARRILLRKMYKKPLSEIECIGRS